MITRRQFLRLSGAGTLSLFTASQGKFFEVARADIPGGTLDPSAVC
ncbi:MAG: twin-arginine translocation signal domain-containing protein [Acidobacteriota bacterium]